jgi:hypothetical protein
MEEIMAAKAPSVKRYVVRLSAEERQQLEAMINASSSARAEGVNAVPTQRHVPSAFACGQRH